MPKTDIPSSDDAAAVEAAIARVLQAESAARDAVTQCTSDAEAIVEQAQQHARAIARRAAQRAVRVQRWLVDALQHRLAELASDHRTIDETAAEADAGERLNLAAARLAAELTGVGR